LAVGAEEARLLEPDPKVLMWGGFLAVEHGASVFPPPLRGGGGHNDFVPRVALRSTRGYRPAPLRG
jgi:hypothetical protein